MQYKEKLKNPKWKSFSSKVLSKDGYTCTMNCGWSRDNGIPLQAHHTVYYVENGKFVEPWDYQVDELVTLCERCHTIIHNQCSMPIRDKKTGKLMNESKAYRRTRLAIEKKESNEIN